MKVWYSSHALSAAMTMATLHARAFTQPGFANSPIFERSLVNSTRRSTKAVFAQVQDRVIDWSMTGQFGGSDGNRHRVRGEDPLR
jgi:hypothetical protein